MKTYESVGIDTGLEGLRLKLYIDYMRKRWNDPKDEAIKCQVGYAQEWADRFLSNSEWECSDSQGLLVLKELMGK